MTTSESIFNTLNGFGNGMKDMITQAATLLGEATLHLYKVLVMQQVAIGIQQVVWAISYFGAAGLLYMMYKKISKKNEIHYQDKMIIYGVIAIVGLHIVSTGISHLNAGLPYLINPEYYALMEAKNIVQDVGSSLK